MRRDVRWDGEVSRYGGREAFERWMEEAQRDTRHRVVVGKVFFVHGELRDLWGGSGRALVMRRPEWAEVVKSAEACERRRSWNWKLQPVIPQKLEGVLTMKQAGAAWDALQGWGDASRTLTLGNWGDEEIAEALDWLVE